MPIAAGSRSYMITVFLHTLRGDLKFGVLHLLIRVPSEILEEVIDQDHDRTGRYRAVFNRTLIIT